MLAILTFIATIAIGTMSNPDVYSEQVLKTYTETEPVIENVQITEVTGWYFDAEKGWMYHCAEIVVTPDVS